jgi:hypothetical protein
MDGIGEEAIDWRDPLRSHAFYDLTKDAEKILEGIDISNKNIFSQMKHWPPQLQAMQRMKSKLLGASALGDEDLSMSDSDFGKLPESTWRSSVSVLWCCCLTFLILKTNRFG